MESMEELKLQTIDDLFSEISTGEKETLSSRKNYDVIFREMENESIQERSCRASVYREAAKIYLTF